MEPRRSARLFFDSRSDGRTLAGDGLETALYTCDRTPRTASLTLQEEQSGVLLKNGLRRATGLTGHVLLNVFLKYTFDLLCLETTLDDQLVVRVHRTARTQLGQQERLNVLWLPMQSAERERGEFHCYITSLMCVQCVDKMTHRWAEQTNYLRFTHVNEVGERRLLGANS